MKTKLIYIALLLHLPLVSQAQNTVTSSQLGFAPQVPYNSTLVDAINLMNGNGTLNIPLLSFPQRGNLSLAFHLVGNLSAWRETSNCYGNPVQCIYSYVNQTVDDLPFGGPSLSIVEMNQRSLLSDYHFYRNDTYNYSSGGSTYQARSTTYVVRDADGAEHQMVVNASDNSKLHSTDGSGLRAVLSSPSYLSGTGGFGPYRANFSLLDRRGVSSVTVRDPVSQTIQSVTQTDRDGNQIIWDAVNGVFHDSVGRNVNFSFSNDDNGTTNCPAIQDNLAPTSSRIWTVPGVQGNSQNFLICLATIKVLTNFLGNGGAGEIVYTGDPGEGDQVPNYYNEAAFEALVIQSITLPNGKVWGFHYDTASEAQPLSYGDLMQIDFPDGGGVQYTYDNQFISGCGGSGDIEERRRILKTRTITDKQGHTFLWSYNIASPFYGPSYSSRTIVTDPNQNDTTHLFGNDANVSLVCSSREIEEAHYDGNFQSSKTPLLRKVFSYSPDVMLPQDPAAQNAPRSWADWIGYQTVLNAQIASTSTYMNGSLVSTEEYQYDMNSIAVVSPVCVEENTDSHCDSVSTATFPSDSIANASLGVRTGVTLKDSNGIVLRSENTKYHWQENSDYLSANLLDVPSENTIGDGSVLFAKTDYLIDEPSRLPSNSSGAKGHITSSTVWNDHGPDILTHTNWTSNGLVDSVVDGNGYITQFNYDVADGAFSPKSIIRLGQVRSFVNDLSTGLILGVTDPNGASTTMLYDSTNRPWALKSADIGGSGYSTVYCYPSPGVIGITSAQHAPVGLPSNSDTCPAANDNSISSMQTYDGIGHQVKNEITSDSQGSIVKEFEFDGLGNAVMSSRPYRVGQTHEVVATQFDPLSRPIQITLSDSPDVKAFAYSGLVETDTDELGNVSVKSRDALNRLIKVTEANTANTIYSYSVLGNLISVSQQGVSNEVIRNRSFTYDSLSRLITSTNPEVGITCYGIWMNNACTFGYDPNGNLKSKIDPRGVATNYSYDGFDRLLAKTYSDSTPSSCYYYDAATNGIGRLSSESTQLGACPSTPSTSGFLTQRSVVSYDALGRVTLEKQCTPANCSTTPYTFLTQYDLAGNPIVTTSGTDTVSLSPSYDSAGRLDVVQVNTKSTDPFQPLILFKALSYGPAGITKWTLGNPERPPLTIEKTYDSRLRPAGETVTGHQ